MTPTYTSKSICMPIFYFLLLVTIKSVTYHNPETKSCINPSHWGAFNPRKPCNDGVWFYKAEQLLDPNSPLTKHRTARNHETPGAMIEYMTKTQQGAIRPEKSSLIKTQQNNHSPLSAYQMYQFLRHGGHKPHAKVLEHVRINQPPLQDKRKAKMLGAQ